MVLMIGGIGMAAMADATTQPTTQSAGQALIGPELHMASLHNVHRLTDRIYSGSMPQTEQDFQALRDAGIKTILSVDGITPKVELANKYGIRYVHLPVGYDGFGRERALEIVRAVRDLPGPAYVHCHHGLQRGPTAACVAAIALDHWTNEQAVEAMHALGTLDHFAGLFDTAAHFAAPTAAELAKADHTFPEISEVPDLVKTMVQIDARHDRLLAAARTGWSTPPNQPGFDAAGEALLLKEDFRELHRREVADPTWPQDFAQRAKKAELQAAALEETLRQEDWAGAKAQLKNLGVSCSQCHNLYRDPPLE